MSPWARSRRSCRVTLAVSRRGSRGGGGREGGRRGGGRQAKAPRGLCWSGRKTLKSVALAMVVSTRRTPGRSYILMELPFTQCLTRTPSARSLKLVVSSPVKLPWALRPRKRMMSGLWKWSVARERGGQPLAPVETDLDREGEPGLEAGVEDAKDAVAVVLVNVETLPWPEPEAALARVRGTMVLETHAGLDGLEGADQAVVHGILGEQAARELLLVGGAGLEVADGAVMLHRLPERGRLDTFAGRQDVLLEVEEADLGPLQEAEHAPPHHQRQERAANHEAVEPGQHRANERAIASEESVHGVVLGACGRPVRANRGSGA